jgi:hypothetical protein
MKTTETNNIKILLFEKAVEFSGEAGEFRCHSLRAAEISEDLCGMQASG